MNTHTPAETTIRPARLIEVLCGVWLCAGLAAAPTIADAAPVQPTALIVATDGHAAQPRAVDPQPNCRGGRHRIVEIGSYVEVREQPRSRAASPASAPPAAMICRLAIAAELSIRANPTIF